MEACGGAHEWARKFQAHAHRVGIMMARFVAPYRKSSKDDATTRERSAKRAQPNMRFVPVKSAKQQAILALRRVRQGFIEQRTATINCIRGLLAAFGMVLPQRAEQVRRAAVVVAAAWPVLAREAIADLRAHLSYLDGRIGCYERQLVELARQREAAVRIQRLPGVGPLTASAITASISDGHEFAERISEYKNALVLPSMVEDDDERLLYEGYDAELRASAALDYDDLLSRSARISVARKQWLQRPGDWILPTPWKGSFQ